MKNIFPLVLAVFFAAHPAFAAMLSVEAPASAVPPSSQFSFSVVLTTDAHAVNVVEGAVKIPQNVQIDGISTAGSAFTLWPMYPEYVTIDRKIEFSGGAPGGVPAGAHMTLFTVFAHAGTADAYEFAPADITAYRNDGKGTEERVSVQSLTVDVHPGASAAPSASLKSTPIVANVGNDPALFDGQYFVSFYGGDRGKGVSYYEVQEGVFDSWNRADRFYVLKNQSLNREISVRAVDEDGVSAKTTIHAPNGNRVFTAFGTGALFALLILGCYLIIRRIFAKRRSQ